MVGDMRCATTRSLPAAIAICTVGTALATPTPASAADAGMEAARSRSLVVVRVVFDAATPDPAPPASIQTAFHRSSSSVNAYFGAQTGGALGFRGASTASVDVLPADGPPLVVPRPASCDTVFGSVAQAVSARYGSALAPYDHVMVAIPRYDCTWAGRGLLPGRWTVINGATSFASSRILSHELGHNMGADHATTWTCVDPAGNRVTLSADCETEAEYGDPFDVMGSVNTTSLMSAYNRLRTGTFPAARVATVSSGDHELTDLAATDVAGPQLLMVPRPGPDGGPSTESFAVEMRAAVAPFDVWPSIDSASTGLTIRLVPGPGRSGPTKLLDTTPTTGTYVDAPLGDQRTFTDPVSGTRISLVSRQGRTATVRIGGEPLLDTTPPAFSPGVLTAIVKGRQVVLQWPVATDNHGIDHYGLLRDGATVATTRARTATDVLPADLETARYDVRAVDAAGNATLIGAISVSVTGVATGAGGPVGPVGVAGPNAPGPGAAAAAPGAKGAGAGRPAAPGSTAVPAGAAAIVLTAPGLVGRQAVIPRARMLRFSAPGAGRLVVTVNGRRVANAAAASIRVRLTRTAVRRATIVVTASRGTLTATRRLTLKVRRGVITVR